MHHQSFTTDEITLDGTRDWRLTFFSPYDLVVFILVPMPSPLILGFLISADTGRKAPDVRATECRHQVDIPTTA